MRKNKLADALRVKKVYNNWDLLKHFGKPGDVVVEYYPAPTGRAGVGHIDSTRVWSFKKEPNLEKPDRWGASTFEKVFRGRRAESLNPAIEWARTTYGYGFATSPFGGFVPSHLKEKAQAFANNRKEAQ